MKLGYGAVLAAFGVIACAALYGLSVLARHTGTW